MDMLRGNQIAGAGLTDWRKLAQGLHASYLVPDFGAAVDFLSAVGAAGDACGHHPRVRVAPGRVDLELVSDDAVFRDDDGSELVVEWVTGQDVDLARRITDIAAGHGLSPDPSSVTEVELGLDTDSSATIAPVWAALLTGTPEDQGRGTPGDEVRDGRGRLPNLWFADVEAPGSAHPRFHVEVYVAPEVVEQRVAAVVAAGGRVVDDSESPGLTVLADQDGNRGVLCADVSAASSQ